jgi:hypothetical protein
MSGKWLGPDELDGRMPATPFEEACAAEEAGALSDDAVMDIRRDTYRKILQFIFSGGRRTSPEVVLANVIGLAKSHAPDLIDGASLGQYAARMGRTKAALSHQIRHHQSEVIALSEARQGRAKGHHAERWQQSESSVAKFAKAAKGNSNRKKKDEG